MTNDKDGAALLREAIHNALSSELGDTYDCGRVWDAWHVGTMGEDDFTPVNDRVDEITETVLAALKSHGQAFDAAGVREACAKVADAFAGYIGDQASHPQPLPIDTNEGWRRVRDGALDIAQSIRNQKDHDHD